jgi:DNA-binding transcriptional regulator YbjK
MERSIDRKLSEARQRMQDEVTVELRDLHDRLSGIDDDRGAVVLAHLLVVRSVDDLIAAVLPRFGTRLSGQDKAWRESALTDYHRLQLARVITVDQSSPVLDAVDVLRSIRNEFAHRADLRTLDDLKQKMADRLRHSVSSLPSAKSLPPNAPMEQLFGEVLLATLIELQLACAQVRHQFPTLTAIKDTLDEIRSISVGRRSDRT